MRILILADSDEKGGSFSIQGAVLKKGILEAGHECLLCDRFDDEAKLRAYREFRPDVAVGVGWWVETPHLVTHPRSHGVLPVPWLVADGWVANYQEELGSIPLLMVTSRWVGEVYVRDGVRPEHIRVVPEGYDADLFQPWEPDDPRVLAISEKLGIGRDESVILTIGGDAASKGSREVMRALAELGTRLPPWRYVCKTWSGPRNDEQTRMDLELARELGIEDRILFVTGRLGAREVVALINLCDVYASPSRQEGFGRPLVEAQACGKPVITVAGTATRDLVIHGHTGFAARVQEECCITEALVGPDMGYPQETLVKFREPKLVGVRASIADIRDALDRLLCDDKLRIGMGENAVMHARANFHHLVAAQKMIETIRAEIRAWDFSGHGLARI